MSRTVFFSDLDRTLIYSKKFLSEQVDCIPVEKKEGREISYITRDSLSLFKEMQKQVTFIPVSTRSLDTMNRIQMLKDNPPEWMVSDNGLHIYHRGSKLPEWEALIQKAKSKQIDISKSEESIWKMFEDKGLKAIINFENVYLMLKFEEMTGEVRTYMEMLNLSLRNEGYRVEVNSRKAYIMPESVRKEKAVKFLMNLLKPTYTIGAGDSLMDIGMLLLTKQSFVPKHRSFRSKVGNVTKQTGIKAGEEILTNVLKIISN